MCEKLDIPTPGKAGAEVARLFIYGQTPTPEQERVARRRLSLSRMDQIAREVLPKSAGLDGVGAAHVVGLILGQCGVKYDAATLIERIVRDAVEAAQDGGQE